MVTSQTLYAATAASLREYAVLRALGIPRWRMGMTVLAQSFWVGIIGVGAGLAGGLRAWPRARTVWACACMLPPDCWPAAGGVTLVMAMLPGLAALRSLRLVEPATLLR